MFVGPAVCGAAATTARAPRPAPRLERLVKSSSVTAPALRRRWCCWCLAPAVAAVAPGLVSLLRRARGRGLKGGVSPWPRSCCAARREVVVLVVLPRALALDRAAAPTGAGLGRTYVRVLRGRLNPNLPSGYNGSRISKKRRVFSGFGRHEARQGAEKFRKQSTPPSRPLAAARVPLLACRERPGSRSAPSLEGSALSLLPNFEAAAAREPSMDFRRPSASCRSGWHQTIPRRFG